MGLEVSEYVAEGHQRPLMEMGWLVVLLNISLNLVGWGDGSFGPA